MSMFREIPDIIPTSEEKRRIFKSDRKLEGCCIELYKTLLDATRDLILLLMDNGFRKHRPIDMVVFELIVTRQKSRGFC